LNDQAPTRRDKRALPVILQLACLRFRNPEWFVIFRLASYTKITQLHHKPSSFSPFCIFVITMEKISKQDALDYHSQGKPGKIEVVPTKPYSSQRDLSLAYSPGVAEPCLKIAENKEDVYKYTTKGNLVAVISNGTAVLGLGNIGPEASKPVMEGKAVLFKKYAGIDSFDIEIAENDPDEFIKIVKSLEPTFGGINLEDIKAPECFKIEQVLREKMNIPIMR